MLKKITLLIFIIFFHRISYAQDDSSIELGEIVITATKDEEYEGNLTRQIEIIDSSDINIPASSDLSQVLTQSNAINVFNYGGPGATKTFGLRGSNASQTLVLVDGRPINNPRDGLVDLNTITLGEVNRIEIMPAGAGNLYGSNAMGGVVNIITKQPPKDKPITELTSSFGTKKTYLEKFLQGARLKKLGYLITSQYESSQGFRPNSQFDSKNINTKFDYEISEDNILSLNSGFYRSKVGVPGPVNIFDPDDKQKRLKRSLDLTWNIKFDDTSCAVTKIYNDYDRLEFIENNPNLTKDIQTTQVRGLDWHLNKRLFNDRYLGLIGYNYVKNMNDSTNSAKHKYDLIAGYWDNQIDIRDDFRLDLGARLDSYSNFDTEFNPNFSFLYKIKDNLKLRGLINRVFRVPTFNDLYWPDQNYMKGNSNLKPEKGISSQLAIETTIKNLYLNITYYRSDYDDLIKWGAENDIWQPKNIGSAIIQGGELNTSLKLFDSLELKLDYTFLQALDNKTNKYIIYQPKNKIDFIIKYRCFKDLDLELTHQFVDSRFDNPDNTIKVKRFFLINFSLIKKIKYGISYFLTINNLLNRTYQIMHNYPMPGLALTSGLKWEF